MIFVDGFMRLPAWSGRDSLYGKYAKNLMKTDVRETENTYEVDILACPASRRIRSMWI